MIPIDRLRKNLNPRSMVFSPQVPLITPEIFTVFKTTASTSTLDWSPIKEDVFSGMFFLLFFSPREQYSGDSIRSFTPDSFKRKESDPNPRHCPDIICTRGRDGGIRNLDFHIFSFCQIKVSTIFGEKYENNPLHMHCEKAELGKNLFLFRSQP